MVGPPAASRQIFTPERRLPAGMLHEVKQINHQMTQTTKGGFKLTNPRRSRGYLPHFDGEQLPQFITFRLADTLPKNILDLYRQKLERRLISDIEYHDLIDSYLDRNHGRAYLRMTEVAIIIEENLLRFDGVKYTLHAWVIMPNHAHVLLTPASDTKLHSIMHSMKSYTANRANETLKRSGSFWAREYFDRYIRSGKHFANTVQYIHNNPIKAGLCATAHEWRFSSARFDR